MTKKKRIMLASLGMLLLLSLVTYGYARWLRPSASSSITTDALSERAQEFVQSQQRETGSSWSQIQLEDASGSGSLAPSTLQETPCFFVNLPFAIRSVVAREADDCVLQARVISPAAKLTITATPLAGRLEDDSAVKMRQTFTEIYTVEPFETTLFPDSRTFVDDASVSFFTVKDGLMLAVIFSETNDHQRILHESLPQLLEVLMVY